MTANNMDRDCNFDLVQIQEVVDYIESNITNMITLKSIANHFYLSGTMLNRLFKMMSGYTVIEYVRNRRLSLAGRDLLTSNIRILDLSLRYGYETPESFTKAFVRFYGFPPSLVRRTYPPMRQFEPLSIRISVDGGWKKEHLVVDPEENTDQSFAFNHIYEEDMDYHNNSLESDLVMEQRVCETQIRICDMKYQREWKTLLSLIHALKVTGITFKVDDTTTIFVHGLEFKLDRICLVFRWIDEQKVRNFFKEHGMTEETYSGFKYFYAEFDHMRVQCMFYKRFSDTTTDELLFENTEFVAIEGELIRAQSLQFYYENAKPDSFYYKLVETWLKKYSIHNKCTIVRVR